MAHLTRDQDDDISEATAGRVEKKTKAVLRDELIRELLVRMKAGETETDIWDCHAGAICGAMKAAIDVMWSVMPKGSSPDFLVEGVAKIVPLLIAQAVEYDSGEFLARAQKVHAEFKRRRH